MFLLHVLSLALLFLAIRQLVETIRPGSPALAWVVIFLLILSRFIPGSNLIIGGFDMFEQSFYGYTLGVALMVLALVQLLLQRPMASGVLAGLAFYVHTNYGQHSVLLLAGSILLSRDGWRTKGRDAVRVFLPALLIASPVLIPLLLEEVSSVNVIATRDLPRYFDTVGFRNPHHMWPSTWPLTDHLLYAVSILVLWSVLRLRDRGVKRVDDFWRNAALIVILSCLVGYLNEFLRNDLIAKSYPFRASVLVKILMFAYVASAVHDRLLARTAPSQRAKAWKTGIGVLSVATMAGLILNIRSAATGHAYTVFNTPVLYGIRLDVRPTPLEECVSAHTPSDAVVLIPPDYHGFAVNTRRAPVVTWLNTPHRGHDYIEWYERMKDVSGGAVTRETAKGISDARVISSMARKGYDGLAPGRILELGKKYHASYCVHPAELPFEVVCRSEELVLYKLPP
jgi:hypothetical protein